MVIVSCSTKFHAFNLSEQLERHSVLAGFYTTYAYQKNRWIRRFVSRVDKEVIPTPKIHTHIPLATMIKLRPNPFRWNTLFDSWVARNLRRRSNYHTFIGWSGMSLESLRIAKETGKRTILERGSSHIVFQDRVLSEEYKKLGLSFQVDPRIIKRELAEYELTDFISVGSNFIKESFVDQGVPAEKILVNNYGKSQKFSRHAPKSGQKEKLIVVYLGYVGIRKGVHYLVEAINQWRPPIDVEVWLIGGLDAESKFCLRHADSPVFKTFGHIDHYKLPEILSRADIAVQPSIEDGFAMTVAQLLGMGIPVILSDQTGAKDLIEEGKNGLIVPAANAEAIKESLEMVYQSPEMLSSMKIAAAQTDQDQLTWDAYGDRYIGHLKRIEEKVPI